MLGYALGERWHRSLMHPLAGYAGLQAILFKEESVEEKRKEQALSLHRHLGDCCEILLKNVQVWNPCDLLKVVQTLKDFLFLSPLFNNHFSSCVKIVTENELDLFQIGKRDEILLTVFGCFVSFIFSCFCCDSIWFEASISWAFVAHFSDKWIFNSQVTVIAATEKTVFHLLYICITFIYLDKTLKYRRSLD